MLKNKNYNEMSETFLDSFTVSKGDSNLNENIMNAGANAIVTSTPQKLTGI